MATRSTTIAVPPDVTDPVQLKRFLIRLVEQIDLALGNRSTESVTTIDTLNISSVSQNIESGNDSLADRISDLESRVTELEP